MNTIREVLISAHQAWKQQLDVASKVKDKRGQKAQMQKTFEATIRFRKARELAEAAAHLGIDVDSPVKFK